MKKILNKKNHSNIQDLPSAINWSASGFSELPFGMTPSNDKYLDNLALKLLYDVFDDSKGILSIEQWRQMMGISESTYFTYLERHENMKIANREAIIRIGTRREERIEKGAPFGLSFVLPQYSPSWRAESDRKAALKANLDNKGPSTITVVMQPIEKESK